MKAIRVWRGRQDRQGGLKIIFCGALRLVVRDDWAGGKCGEGVYIARCQEEETGSKLLHHGSMQRDYWKAVRIRHTTKRKVLEPGLTQQRRFQAECDGVLPEQTRSRGLTRLAGGIDNDCLDLLYSSLTL